MARVPFPTTLRQFQLRFATEEAAGSGPRPPAQQGVRIGDPVALRQVRESAQALLAEGKIDAAFGFFVTALDAVLRKTKALKLLVAKLRREQVGTIKPAPLDRILHPGATAKTKPQSVAT